MIRTRTRAGVKVNVTALLTLDQVRGVSAALAEGAPACISVFAGRVADTDRDPVPLMAAAVELLRAYPNIELIWASPRELLNVVQADTVGCHIITATNDILAKLPLVGKDLHEYSLDTVKMFRDDALKVAGTGSERQGSPHVVAHARPRGVLLWGSICQHVKRKASRFIPSILAGEIRVSVVTRGRWKSNTVVLTIRKRSSERACRVIAGRCPWLSSVRHRMCR